MLVCIIIYDTPLFVFTFLIPIGLIVFSLSLIIGHFITEPLRFLYAKTKAFLDGNTQISFKPDGRLYESDLLAQSFEDLAKTSASQQADLVLREKRQKEFVSDVAHELRTPLTSIHGNAEILLDPELPDEMHDKFCNIIITESERLGRLTNDLLTLQRIENEETRLELRRVNLNNLASDVLDALEPILRQRKANTRIIGEAPDVLGNLDRLKQVVSNLVENASRFIEPGGNITIELFGLKGNSIIAVKDDGKGFGDADPKLLFDRFYRADSSRSRETGGTGLGLSIVRSITEAHDGTVEAVNLPDGGACFIVALPSIPIES